MLCAHSDLLRDFAMKGAQRMSDDYRDAILAGDFQHAKTLRGAFVALSAIATACDALEDHDPSLWSEAIDMVLDIC